jgi:hypothetical protein
MNEKYLWDKSGEPDPEIQQLEQILGTLRYQPRPLELPIETQPARRNRHLPFLAIAASLVLALLTGIFWLTLRNRNAAPENEARRNAPSIPPSSPVSSPGDKQAVASNHEEKKNLVNSPHSPNRRRETIPLDARGRHSSQVSTLNKHEREQALEAKEQLMVALRLASEKLNLAQRKAQGPAPNQIRNQHKIG